MSGEKLDRSRLHSAEHSFTLHDAYVPENATLEDILRPDYWGNCAQLIRANDEMRILWEDESRRIYAYVVAVTRNWVKIKVLSDISLRDDSVVPEVVKTSEFEPVWRGIHYRWGVRKKANKEIVIPSLKTKEEAENWIKDFMKKAAA
jgi:hypothetical protein